MIIIWLQNFYTNRDSPSFFLGCLFFFCFGLFFIFTLTLFNIFYVSYLNITVLAIFRQLYKTMTHNFCAKDSVLTKWFDPFSMSVYARRCEVELMHCESIDWNEAFLTKKGQLNGGKPLVSILFLTLYMISVSFTRISKLFFRGKKLSCQ